MYGALLVAHNITRWLVIVAVIWSLAQLWGDYARGRVWSAGDERAGTWLVNVTSLQFVIGLLLYVFPYGLAQAALGNLPAALRTTELWFFGLAHPLLMSAAVGLAHLGRARARKATADRDRFRWALSCYSGAALLILIAIPWWRPLLRGL